MVVALAPLVPAAGKAALVLAKGGLTRAAIRSLVTGAAFQAGAEIVNQIAEWARSIGGEFDTTDSPGGIDGCKTIEDGGYGQLQYSLGGDNWANEAAGGAGQFCTSITGTSVLNDEVGGRYCSTVSITAANVEGGLTWQTECFQSEGQAGAVKYRIVPTNGTCKETGRPDTPNMDEPVVLPPMQSGDCNINVSFHGFLAAEDGTGTVRPVFEWTPALPPGRASGGVIVGDCNFQPTISVGGGGDGGDPPIIIPGPGGDDGPFPPGSDEWWEAIAKGAAAGAVGAIVNKLLEGLLTVQEPSSFTLEAPCDVDEDGNPLTYTVDFPQETQSNRIQRWQVAQAYLIQQHLNWKTPTCGGNDKPELEGDWRTVSFRSDHTSPYGKSRLRKRFRYRSTSGWSYDDLINHWKDFVFQSGPVIVQHSGSSWGTPQVWAATADEGKRVIRHAAGEAGLDPDQVGRWTISGSSGARYGVSDTMRVETKGGYYWITARDGSDARPLVGKVPHP